MADPTSAPTPPAGPPAARPPSVDALAARLRAVEAATPDPLLVDAARQAVEDVRAGRVAHDQVGQHAAGLVAAARRRLLGPVVNATGVLLHTNLGRAPLGHHQDEGYSNLELDLDTGARGSRSERTAALLARACGAEAALVVNNGAAAVLLALAALAAGRGVVVSRGELVEIGGGFRVPEVLAQSGARLLEVGTTNRTRRADVEAALADPGSDAALVLKVHRSNYRIVGFTSEVPLRELAGLGVPVVADLGSGLLDAACPWLPGGPPPWLAGEPAARQSLRDGAGLVTFSGDKLLGGPQAGVVAGDAALVRRCAAHPLARALRPGSLVLGALQAVALAYLRRDGAAVPFWRMATLPVDELAARAAAVVDGARARGGHATASVVGLDSVPGGGTLPGVTIASAGIAVDGDVRDRLRAAGPPVVARVEDGRTLLDLRTVLPGQDGHVAAVLAGLPPG